LRRRAERLPVWLQRLGIDSKDKDPMTSYLLVGALDSTVATT